MAEASEFVKVAKAEVGCGPSKYNTGGLPWCAIFVNWCLEQIGYSRKGTAAAASFADFGENHKSGDGYVPKDGDLVLVNLTADKSYADHIAIIEKGGSTYCRVINGNGTGDRVTVSMCDYRSLKYTVVEMTWDTGADGEKITYFADTNEKLPLHPTIFSQPELKIDGELAVYAGLHNITASVAPIEYESSIEELAKTISLTVAKSDARFTYLYEPQIGDIIRLFTPNEVFRGVIVADSIGGKYSSEFTAVDAGWYLNKTKDTYQFNDMDALDAVKKLFADLGVPIAYISEAALTGHTVSGVYTDKAISEILKDILNQVGGEWNFDMTPFGVRVYTVGTFVAEPKFKTASNTAERQSVKYRGEETIEHSIEDMRNSVKAVSDTNVLHKVRNDESYQRFGLLQETVKVDTEKENAEAVAENKLSELCYTKINRGFPMVVEMSDNTSAGDVIYKNGESFIVSHAKHEIKRGRHLLTVELEGSVS